MTSQEIQNFARDGVLVIPIYTIEELQPIKEVIYEEIEEFPEYINPSIDEQLVSGGFGAFGNPASFHFTMIRELRNVFMATATPFFKEYDVYMGKRRNLQQLLDRLSIRHPGKKVKESWHRDQAPCSYESESFGGWLNLDNEDQILSYVPGTHILGGKIRTSGFAKMPNQREAELLYRSRAKICTIPPGSLLIFFHGLVHEIASKLYKQQSLRLYVGWVLGESTEPLFPLDDVINYQGVPRIPSGQIPPMFSNMCISCRKDELIRWSKQTFKPECLVTRISTIDKQPYTTVARYMESLASYGFPMYPPYSEEHRNCLLPQPLFPKDLDLENDVMETENFFFSTNGKRYLPPVPRFPLEERNTEVVAFKNGNKHQAIDLSLHLGKLTFEI